jgi:hypothetical protein
MSGAHEAPSTVAKVEERSAGAARTVIVAKERLHGGAEVRDVAKELEFTLLGPSRLLDLDGSCRQSLAPTADLARKL